MAAASAVPGGFQGVDLTFVSDSKGWALGLVKCPSLQQCAAVAHTEDSGASWTGNGAPAAAVPVGTGQIDCFKATPCVGSIRFGSAQAGYAYRPALFHTLDGGQTWQKEADNSPTLGLEYSGQSAFRIAGYGNTLDCFGGCRIQHAARTGGPWTDVGIVIRMAGAAIVPQGSQRIYVLGLANPAGGANDKKATIYYSGNAGASWQTRNDPCPGDSFTEGAATAPGWHIAILCLSNLGASATVVLSDDASQTFHAAGPAPIGYGLTAGNGTILSGVGYQSNGTTVYTTSDGGAHWRATLNCPSGQQLYALGYQDEHTAHVICPESTVWRSHDGAATWTHANFSQRSSMRPYGFEGMHQSFPGA